MFDKFPREISFPKREGPYRVVYNQKQMNEVVNKLNGKKNLFTTIYSFKRLKTNDYGILVPDYSSANIDKLFFDFDTKHCFENIKKFHGNLLINNIMHTILFSGGGFHLYIMCEDKNLLFPYDAVENAQRQFASNLKLTIGDPNNEIKGKPILDENKKPVIFDIDEATIGDLARVGRIPHTYNIKRRRWCIPIHHKDLLEKSFDDIKKMASEENCERLGKPPSLYGNKKVDLSLYDHEIPKKKEVMEETIPLLGQIKHISKEKFPPCIENMIVRRSGCYGWYWATIWFRDKAYTRKETDMVMKKYLSVFKRTDGQGANDYIHYRDSDKHLQNVYNDKTSKHWFPSAQHLFQKGFCPGRCKFYKEGKNCLYFGGDVSKYTGGENVGKK